jgi:hypothetical protein
LLILVDIYIDAMHFLKHCPLVSVADKRYIYLFPFQFIGVMYSSRVYRMVEEWTACMRLLSWRRHQGTMLKNCICLVYEHMSPFCIVVTVDIIMNVYLLLPLEGP